MVKRCAHDTVCRNGLLCVVPTKLFRKVDDEWSLCSISAGAKDCKFKEIESRAGEERISYRLRIITLNKPIFPIYIVGDDKSRRICPDCSYLLPLYSYSITNKLAISRYSQIPHRTFLSWTCLSVRQISTIPSRNP